MSTSSKSSCPTSSPGKGKNTPMATRRSTYADKAAGMPAATADAPRGASPDEQSLITRIAMLEQVLVTKLDSVVGELRAEFTNTVKVLEATSDKLKTENDELREELKVIKTEVNNNNTKLATLEITLQKVQGHSIANEQYSRRRNVRIFGMREEAGENCVSKVFDLVTAKQGRKLTDQDIEVAHRLPAKVKPWPVIVQFRSRDIKLDVMKRRRVLKGSGIVIADDLCNCLLNTCNRLKPHPECKKAWSWDGQLFAELKTGRVIKVRWAESLEAAAERYAARK